MAVNIGPRIGIDGEKEYRKQIQDLVQDTKTLKAEMERVSAQYSDAADATKKHEEQVRILTESVDKQREKVAKLNEMYGRAREELGDTDSKTQKWKEAVENATAELHRMEDELKSMTGLNHLADQLESASNSLKDIGGSISSAGKTLSARITAPVVAIGTASTKMAMDFEDAMAKVSTIADDSMPFDDLRESIMALSDQTGVSASEIADNVYNAISAGQNTADAVAFVEQTTKLARAGFAETGDTLDVLSTIMNTYGDEVKSVSNASDVLIQTQNKGKTTVGELSSSLGQVLPVAHSAGLSFEETAATIAVLTKNGIGTSQAVTGLKGALSNIIKPSTDARKAADALGIDFSAAALNSKGLSGMMAEIKAQMESASPEYAKAAESVAGYGEKIADLTSKQDVNKSRIAELTAENEKLSESLKAVGDGGKEMKATIATNKAEIQALTKENKELNTESKGLEKAMKGEMETMDLLGSATDSPISAYSKLFGSVEGLNSMMVLASEQGGKDMADIMGAMSDSAGLTEESYDKLKTTSWEAQQVWNELKNTGIELGEAIITTFGPALKELAEGLKDIMARFRELSPEQQKQIVKIALVVAAIGPLLVAIGSVISAIGSIMGVGSKLLGGIAKYGPAIKGLIAPIAGVVSVIAGVALAVTNFVDMFQHGFDVVKEILMLLGIALAAVGAVLLGAPALVAGVVAGIVAVVANLAILIKNHGDEIKAGIEAFIKGVQEFFEKLGEKLSEIWNAIKKTISTVVKGIKDAITGAFNSAKTAVVNIFNKIKDTAKEIWTNIKNTIKNLVNGARDAIKNGFQAAKDAVFGIFNSIKEKIEHIMDTIKETVSHAIDYIKGLLEDIPVIGDLIGGIGSLFGGGDAVETQWNAGAMQNGTILRNATIFGAANGKLQGAGEVGAEVVVGANSLQSMIRSAVRSAYGYVPNVTNNNTSINMTINGAQGQSEAKLADEVMARLGSQIDIETIFNGVRRQAMIFKRSTGSDPFNYEF